MSRDYPTVLSGASESAVTPPKGVSSARESRPLSMFSSLNAANAVRLTRGQVATRLGISVSTVRRLEGTRLHPTIDGDDVRWFDEREVAALAAELVNTTNTKRRGTRGAPGVETTPARSQGEIAALVFERLEQRQSLAEIVVGLRVTPETVRALFEQWSLGLTEGQLRMDGEPALPRASDFDRVKPAVLAARLAELPDDQLTRISVARFREWYPHGVHEFALLDELGGFHVSGPCTVREITQRHGGGSYRVTAYGFNPNGLRWELLVEGLDGN